MKKIPTQEAKPKMVIARNVYGKNENLIMAKGITLSSESIGQLSRMGIQSLWIEAPDEKQEMSSEDIARIKKEVEEKLVAQFEMVSHNPIIQGLKKVFKDYLIKKRTL